MSRASREEHTISCSMLLHPRTPLVVTEAVSLKPSTIPLDIATKIPHIDGVHGSMPSPKSLEEALASQNTPYIPPMTSFGVCH